MPWSWDYAPSLGGSDGARTSPTATSVSASAPRSVEWIRIRVLSSSIRTCAGCQLSDPPNPDGRSAERARANDDMCGLCPGAVYRDPAIRAAVRASHGDDDLALGVSFSLVPESFRSVTERVTPTDDRSNLSGFDELL